MSSALGPRPLDQTLPWASCIGSSQLSAGAGSLPRTGPCRLPTAIVELEPRWQLTIQLSRLVDKIPLTKFDRLGWGILPRTPTMRANCPGGRGLTEGLGGAVVVSRRGQQGFGGAISALGCSVTMRADAGVAGPMPARRERHGGRATELSVRDPPERVLSPAGGGGRPGAGGGLHRPLVQPDALPGERLGRPAGCRAGGVPLAQARRRGRVLLRGRAAVPHRPGGPHRRPGPRAGPRGPPGGGPPHPGAGARRDPDGGRGWHRADG